MKLIFLLIMVLGFSLPALANSRNRPLTINTLGGKIIYQNPYQKQNDSLKGVGQEFLGEAKINKEGEVTVFISGCKHINLGNQKDEELEKAELSKLQAVKNGDLIKIRMREYGKCEVSEWRKN